MAFYKYNNSVGVNIQAERVTQFSVFLFFIDRMALESWTATGTTTATAITGGENGAFECNICFELAQDPVITPCGHLHCWPCIYKWLNIHSNSHQCPVCRSLIQQDMLVPLYGRGNAPTDPRFVVSLQNPEIPQRPAWVRPETTVVVAPTSRRGLMSNSGRLSPVLSVRFYDVYGGPSRFVYGSIGEDEHAAGSDKTMMKILVFVLLFVLFDVMAM